MAVVPEAASASPLPADYYRSIDEVEERHWWHRGMREIARALLGERLARPGLRLLDAGCGTGGFLAWTIEVADVARAAGVDVSEEALAFAGRRVPAADLRLAPVSRLPFDDAAFDLIVLNDVLQHIREDEVEASPAELGRVLAPGGALLVRTNGARRARREAADWRLYDRDTLRGVLTRAGLRCERLTHANLVGSAWAGLRGRSPTAPTATSHGIPALGSARGDAAKERLLRAEARYLRRPGRSLPYGHTLFALAVRAEP
jgi:SAM-dependent methyltransferase